MCGTQSHQKPKLDISGLFAGFSSSSGTPEVCHDGGVVNSTVHVNQSKGGRELRVQMFWRGTPDIDKNGCPEGTSSEVDVKYLAKVEGCYLEAGDYPPTLGGGATVITCPGGAPVEFKTEGGGNVTKKCGCTAVGSVVSPTPLRFNIIPPA